MARYRKRYATRASKIRSRRKNELQFCLITGFVLFAWGWYQIMHKPSDFDYGLINRLDHFAHQQIIALPVTCWLITLFAAALYLRSQRKKAAQHFFQQQKTLADLQRLSWQDFETLCGMALSKCGYQVEQTGLGGADGGIDLLATKSGKKFLIQCKRWNKTSIGVPVVREMLGLCMHHRADGIKIITCGHFTKEAIEFANQHRQIDLINGQKLFNLIQSTKKVATHDHH